MSSLEHDLEKQTHSLSIALTEKSQQLEAESCEHAAILRQKSAGLDSLLQQKSELEHINLAKETQIQQLTHSLSEKSAELEFLKAV